MATYSGMAPEIMQARQFGGYAAALNSSTDPSAADDNAANATRTVAAVKTLATANQATRKSSM